MAAGSRRIIEGHHDFAVLEARLADHLRAARAGDTGRADDDARGAGAPVGAFAPVAVVVPTRRLIDHLRIVLARSFPALLNVHFFHHQALARAAVAAAGEALPRVAPNRVLEAILARVVAAAGGDLASYVAARPGAISTLLASLIDLREAGIPPEPGGRTAGLSDRGRLLLKLYAPFSRALETLRRQGLTDRAGLLAAARPHLTRFATGFPLVVHYGAYDLTGAALDLMQAVEAGAERTVYLTPHHPDSPAYAYARRFWPVAFGAEPTRIEPDPHPGPDAGARLCGALLPALYTEDARPDPPAMISAFHAQGAAAELREAALRILALHRDHGIELRDVGVISRSLEPYAAILEPVFSAHGLPFTTSASLPAVREVRVQAAIQLARLATGDYERQPLMDLARSGLLRLDGRPVGAEAHGWDNLARAFKVTGGFDGWTEQLPAWVEAWQPYAPADDPEAAGRVAIMKEARRRQAAALAGAVRRIERAVRPLRRAAGWSAWADRLKTALAGTVDGFAGTSDDDRGVVAVASVLGDLRDFEAAGVPFSTTEAWRAFETGLQDLSIPIGAVGGNGGTSADDNGGVRVLDTMQARGLSFRAVFLIGLNADLFPRRAAEDPFLGDADRRALRGDAGVPLALSSTAFEEEHLLLAHMIGSARDHLVVSWQRADDAGRARVPSLVLREIARVGWGDPAPDLLTGAAHRVPGHPGEAADDAWRLHGMLPPREALTGAALACAGAGRLGAILADLPSLDPTTGSALRAGLEMVEAIEDGDGRSLRFDACPGPGSRRPEPVSGSPGPEAITWSPSRLETFGQCPQRHFFAHVLKVGELDEAAPEWEIDPADLGGRIHEVLRTVFAGIRDAGDLVGPGTDPDRVVRRARALLPAAWNAATAELEARLGPRYPALWEALRTDWNAALERFLDDDTAALARDGARLIGIEQEARAALDLGDGVALRIHGRLDRAVAVGDRLRVSDYKTSKRIESFTSMTAALKGQALQIPLYILMAEANAGAWGAPGLAVEAEVLGVGPWFTSPGTAVPRDLEARVTLEADTFSRNRAGLLETLRVLAVLADSGSYPLNPGPAWCGWCPYRRACRRDHGPTLDRVQAVEAFADYFLLAAKNTRAATLEAVRFKAGGAERLTSGEDE